MKNQYENFAFSGGGILGIAYIGMLEYLYQIGVIQGIKRVAGTSAGAITACIASFNLPFQDTKKIADSLEYSKVPSKTEDGTQGFLSDAGMEEIEHIFGDMGCVYRLIKDYGLYSTGYFYDFIKAQIEEQFDVEKKAPPYTFLDFQDSSLHKNGRRFKELFIVGTDVTALSTSVFCADYTPHMEVAEAVRISMSVPLFFEAVKLPQGKGNPDGIYVDGGLMYNYPLTLFDADQPNERTLGALFKEKDDRPEIKNLIDYIIHILSCMMAVQRQFYEETPENVRRSIEIDTGSVAALDFNVKAGDEVYQYLYQQGYRAAELYFKYMLQK